jgi:hypothetical protein
MTLVEMKEAIKAFMKEWDVWLGHHKVQGWVVQDLQHPDNGSGWGDQRCFVRCVDGVEVTVSRIQWGSSDYRYAPKYLESIAAGPTQEEAIVAAQWAMHKGAEGIRAKRLERIDAEIKRQEAAEMRFQSLPLAAKLAWVLRCEERDYIILKLTELATKHNLVYAGKPRTGRSCRRCGEEPPTGRLHLIRLDNPGADEFYFGPECLKRVLPLMRRAVEWVDEGDERSRLEENIAALALEIG